MNEQFQQRFDYYLRKKGWQQQELAERLSVDPSTLSKWKSGITPWKVANLNRVCELLELEESEALELFTLAGLSQPSPIPEPPKTEAHEVSVHETSVADLKDEKRQNHNLPARRNVICREEDLNSVLEAVKSHNPIVSIEGDIGSGKSLLAAAAGYDCLDSLSDCPFEFIVWICARIRPEQKHWFNEVLDTIAEVLRREDIHQFPVERKSGAVTKLLRTHRTLIIIDHFDTIADLELENWLYQLPEPSKVLLTGRILHIHDRLVVELKRLSDADTINFICSYAENLNIKAIASNEDPNLIKLLGEVTDGNPRAITLALEHLRYRATLDDVIDQISHADKRVENIFDAFIASAWENQLSDSAKKLLMVLPFFASATHHALAAVTELAESDLEELLKELVDRSLVKCRKLLENRLATFRSLTSPARAKQGSHQQFTGGPCRGRTFRKLS